MEPLVIPQRDEEEDFGKHLLELLGSPVSRHYNGISNLFSPDLNAGSSYELLPAGSLGSPDFTRQLNSAGLHDLNHCNGRQQQGFPTWQLPPQNLPTLQLPQHSWPGGWQAEGWLPQSPTCPVLSPLGAQLNCGNVNSSLFANGTANHANGFAHLTNGNGYYYNGSNGLQFDQLLAGSEPQQQQQQRQQQAQTSLLSTTAAAMPAPLAYAPITPQQPQLLQELPPAVKQELQQQQQQQQWPPLKPQAQLQPVKSQPQHVQQAQQAQQVRPPPPGVRLVAPAAPKFVPPVVQQSATAGAGAALINAFGPQQQNQQALSFLPGQQQQQQRQGRKRVLHLPASALRKAPRTSSSSSPSPSAAAAVATAAMGTDGHQQHLQSIPEEGIANIPSPTTPTIPAAAGVAATTAAAGNPGSAGGSAFRGGAHPGLGMLVWGKVNRFPWWPAVVIPPETADEPAPSPDAAQVAPSGSGSSSKPHLYVRFLGTHDTAWLEPGKISPWPVQLADRSSKTKAGAFVRALKEGRTYAATGTLPDVFSAELPGAVHKQQQQQQDSHAGSAQHEAAVSGSKSPHLVGSTDSSRGASAGDSHSRSSSEQPPESSSSALRPKPEAVDAPSLVGEATADAGAPAAGALDATERALAAAVEDTAGAGVGLSVPAGTAGVAAEVEAGNLPGAHKESGKKAPVARPAAQRSAAASRAGMRTSLRSAQGTQQSAVEVRHTRSGRQLRG